ncbi:alpha/beta hydrolase, partial [bacterium]|nr:alpha/beta hydrolase [bacterium]
MKLLKKILLFLLVGIVILGVGFVIYGYTPARSMPEAAPALLSDEHVKVSAGKWLVFQPIAATPKEGFIFYPGGRVDIRAYAPMAKTLAEKGILVVVIRMPLNLAVFGINKADAVIQAFPEIGQWMIGGHSLG